MKALTIQEYKALCKKDVLRIGQDVTEIKLGTTVQSKILGILTNLSGIVTTI